MITSSYIIISIPVTLCGIKLYDRDKFHLNDFTNDVVLEPKDKKLFIAYLFIIISLN